MFDDRPRLYPILGRAGRLVCGSLLIGACTRADPDDTDVQAPDTCPRAPTGEVPPGDANGDGAVDLADPVVILRRVAEGGADPACLAAVDLVPDARLELDDAFSLLIHLYEGAFSLPEDVDCAGATPQSPPACAPVEARITGDTVELRADTLRIEAWSLGVTAEGCTLTTATTAGTAAAAVIDAPPGLRDLGYDATFVAEAGATSAVVLAFMDDRALPVGAWSPVLRLGLARGEGCACVLRVGPPVAALGEPVESLVVADGAAWPLTAEATVDLCG